MNRTFQPSFTQVYDSETLELLNNEYIKLNGECYLDHAGTTLYSNTQIKKNINDLTTSIYPNPHSATGTGNETFDIIERTRYRILDLFKARSDEYSLIFTSGATASLKIIAETFKFHSNNSPDINKNGNFVYLQDNHTSVLGMRDLVVKNGAKLHCLTHEKALNIFSSKIQEIKIKNQADNSKNNSLFVYSAQSNFSGFKYPLEWIDNTKNGILNSITNDSTNWYILLDAAGFVGTNSLNLSVYKPDFICLSFYKIFGYPSGIGALIVKNSSANVLDKIYYGGGTVNMAHSIKNYHVKRDTLHQRFEDGTLPFHSIIALQHGLDIFAKLSIDKISSHVFSLSNYLYNLLSALNHANGNSVVKIYRDTDYRDEKYQGGILTFNLLRSNGDYIGYMEVLHMAGLFKIHLRTGCFCNPGACQRHLGLTDDEIIKNYNAGFKCGGDRDLIDGKPTGAVRISFGFMSRIEDIETLMTMIKKCFLNCPEILKIPINYRVDTLILNDKNKQKDDDGEKIDKQMIDLKKIKIPLDAKNLIVKNNDNNEKKQEINYLNKLKVSRLFIYPIKSCGALEINKSWSLNSKGLEYDREWMIMTSSGICITQKQNIKLCQIKPTINLNENILQLNYPGMPTAVLPLNNENNDVIKNGEMYRSRVCGHRVEGIDCGSEISEWLSLALGRPNLRLIRQNDKSELFHKNKLELSFSSQAQFLMINEGSVKWLIKKIPNDSDCNRETILHRFRGNIIVEGAEPFEEENWTNLTIGKNTFKVNGQCTRCQMVCIDQETGIKTVEPLQQLAKEFKGNMKFGIYLTKITDKSKVISINDPIIFSK